MDFWDIVMAAATQAGGAAHVPEPGPNLVTNGTFDDGTGWTLTGNDTPVITGGVFTSTGGGSIAIATTTANDTLVVGTYRVTFTILNRVAGAATVSLAAASAATTSRNADGTYVEDIVVSSVNGQTIAVNLTGFPNVQVDDVIVQLLS